MGLVHLGSYIWPSFCWSKCRQTYQNPMDPMVSRFFLDRAQGSAPGISSGISWSISSSSFHGVMMGCPCRVTGNVYMPTPKVQPTGHAPPASCPKGQLRVCSSLETVSSCCTNTGFAIPTSRIVIFPHLLGIS